MTTEEKLQHFTTYAMEEARHKSDVMIREYTDAMEKIFQEHQEFTPAFYGCLFLLVLSVSLQSVRQFKLQAEKSS